MVILIAATLFELVAGTVPMLVIFTSVAAAAYCVAARADLAAPLLSIFIFRLVAQLAMTIGTGSLLLTTIVHETPACVSLRLKTRGWPAPLVRLFNRALPARWVRRAFGVQPPLGPPFLRVMAAVLSQQWLYWVPSFGLPSLLSLPGSITFRPTPADAQHPASVSPIEGRDIFGSPLSRPVESPRLTGVYTYTCQDEEYGDFRYIFRYSTYWLGKPASLHLLRAAGSLFFKMMLLHAYASLFMLLSQGNCRDAFVAEIRRRLDRFGRWYWPRPEVRRIPIEPGDVCAFCHEELAAPPPADDEAEPPPIHPMQIWQAAALRARWRREPRWWCGWWWREGWAMLWTWAGESASSLRQRAAQLDCWPHAPRQLQQLLRRAARAPSAADEGAGGAAAEEERPPQPEPPAHVMHCRWGCGKAVHRACASAYERNACVYCSAPMT